MDEKSGPPSDNVFVTNLPAEMDEAQFQEIFSAYGTIQTSRFLPGMGKNAGLIRFSTLEEAEWVVENLNGNIPQGLETAVAVRFALPPGSGSSKGKGKDNGNGMGTFAARPAQPYNGGKGVQATGKAGDRAKTLVDGLVESGALPGGKWLNDENALFIGGLPPDTNTVDLYSIFSPFGAIPAKGAKAMQTPDGQCTGIGFVNFIDPEAATNAILTLNGTTMASGRVIEVKVKTARKDQAQGGGFAKKPRY
mmetsp:Transcript_59033/g.127703  ORF Transcript_59033/g.127703 Transcript_59033/m.127703 type:complete len:250 (+) Transcript_59033:52-801(+)